ncbi:MAG: glycosyltransferase family 4 protein [Thermoproteota archaeon]
MTGLYPVEIGGPASVSYYLSRELGSSGEEVTILTRVRKREQLERLKSSEEIANLKNVNIQACQINYDLPNLLNIPLMAYKIRETTKRFLEREYDVVHYNSPPVDAAILLPISARRRKEKQTLAIHGGLFYESKNIIGRDIIKRERNFFERIVVLNNFSRKIASRAGMDESRMVTIPNGVDLEALESEEPLKLEGEPRILFTGRLAEVKGINLLIDAFKNISEEHKKAKLYIVGDGPLRNKAEEQVKNFGMRERVKFEGFVKSTREVYRYYRSADLLVLPSLVENFSITLLEAMGARLPIIASDAEGNREIISDGEDGILFKCGNPRDLEEKVLLLISDPNFGKKMAERAYEKVRARYTWSRVAQSYREMFNSIVDGS